MMKSCYQLSGSHAREEQFEASCLDGSCQLASAGLVLVSTLKRTCAVVAVSAKKSTLLHISERCKAENVAIASNVRGVEHESPAVMAEVNPRKRETRRQMRKTKRLVIERKMLSEEEEGWREFVGMETRLDHSTRCTRRYPLSCLPDLER